MIIIADHSIACRTFPELLHCFGIAGAVICFCLQNPTSPMRLNVAESRLNLQHAKMNEIYF